MLEKQLREETEKWLRRIKKERKQVRPVDDSDRMTTEGRLSGEDLLKNIDAYISDCEHFLKQGKLIEAFEAVIWAYAWLEILTELKVLKKS